MTSTIGTTTRRSPSAPCWYTSKSAVHWPWLLLYRRFFLGGALFSPATVRTVRRAML